MELPQNAIDIKRENLFHLIENGIKAKVNFLFQKGRSPGQTVQPLVAEDIQQMLIEAVIGFGPTFNPRWFEIRNDAELNHVVVLIIDGMKKSEIINSNANCEDIVDIFPDVIEVLHPMCSSFTGVLYGECVIPESGKNSTEQSNFLKICTSQNSSYSWPPYKSRTSVNREHFGKSICKVDLLLSENQLQLDNYPDPRDPTKQNYCYSKDRYTLVTSSSPMFSLDCEMVQMTNDSMAVAHIAIIDEQLQTFYVTLVKPEGEVKNYLKKYSGVDEEILRPVTTTLKDVHKFIQMHLPSDAILCGHSLNFDLHALHIFHPYVIDTSVIFNLSGNEHMKPGLRKLSKKYLKLVIQDSASGHDPVEDAIATMKLVQLKLPKDIKFGNAIYKKRSRLTGPGEKRVKMTTSEGQQLIEKKRAGDFKQTCELKMAVDKQLPVSEKTNTFLSKLCRYGKKAFIISDYASGSQGPVDRGSNFLEFASEPTFELTINKSLKAMNKNDLTVCHINPLENNQNCNQFDFYNCVKTVFTACNDKTLFVTISTGPKNLNCKENLLCMIRLKNDRTN